ncbi:MAG: glycosyltransferase family 2 protein [Parvicellaceae bacterium]
MSKVELSIIIINYKTPDLTIQCLNSIYKSTESINFEIIVVDNFSEDNSLEIISKKFKDVICIQMDYNSGFARANNEGIKKSNGKYILFLNSDTIIFNDVLSESIKKYEKLKKEYKVGLFGCKLLNIDNTVQYSISESFPGYKDVLKANPLYIFISKFLGLNIKKVHLNNHNYNHFTKWLGGAFLLCEKKIVQEENEFFNPKFFMYSEDVEIAYRLFKKGYKHFFWAEKSITHLGGGSFNKKNEQKLGQIIISNWLFIQIAKGKLSFEIYFTLIKFNLYLDSILDKNYRNSSEYILRKSLIKFFNKRVKIMNDKSFFKYSENF